MPRDPCNVPHRAKQESRISHTAIMHGKTPPAGHQPGAKNLLGRVFLKDEATNAGHGGFPFSSAAQ